MATNNEMEWRIGNALYEAVRYRKSYCRVEHAVIFDGYVYQHCSWGLFVKRYTDTDGRRWDMIEVCEAQKNGEGEDDYNLTWKADFSTKGMTFADMVNTIDSIIIKLSPTRYI